jgi:Protein of unknown function (DUF3300)
MTQIQSSGTIDRTTPVYSAKFQRLTTALILEQYKMTTKTMRQFLPVLACSTLLMAGASTKALGQDQAPPQQNASQSSISSPGSSSTAPTVAPQTPAQLDALVAPIALYPDALVAQVLAAAAYPEQVAFADDWLGQNTGPTGSALAQAVDQQSWDPSVKALTQFPSVLHKLAHNLAWTSSLGDAFTNQQADVMAAVQSMRAKAQAAGTLQTSSQITVVQQSPSTIVIKPANPQVVYVPQYNPTVVYGAPIAVPLYVPPPVPVVAAGLYFGSGIAIGASFGGGGWGGGFGWGWNSWNVGWGGGGNVIYNNNTYINRTVINRTTNNNPWSPNNPNGYRPGTDTHYGPNGAYHPNGYYGPNGAFHHDVPGTNPNNQPNGGNNGNHGLIGGNGGVQNGGGDFANRAQSDYHPGTDTHYGPNGDYHPNAYYGPNGGFHRDADTDQRNQPNGGNNGNHGLLGGQNGDQRFGSENGGQRMQANNYRDNAAGRMNQPRSYMSGNGGRDRAASFRGQNSMHQAAVRSRPQHMSAPRNTGGGHRR